MAKEVCEILVGTYEDFIVGYRVLSSSHSGDSAGNRLTLEQSMAVRCHSGSVRCLAANYKGSLAISGGFDEMLNLFDLNRRKLLQTIEVATNCAAFVQDKHILLGSHDGKIYIYEYKNSSMTLVKILGGHKSAITSMSVHPSGKLLLSLSKDNTMRTWNLIKGRQAFVTNIHSPSQIVAWSKEGDTFVIATDKEIYCYEISGSLRAKFTTQKRVNSIEFLTNSILAVGSDSVYLEFIDLEKKKSLMKHDTCLNRVKVVKYIDDDELGIKFVTASSDGLVKVWLINRSSKLEEPQELASTDTGARLTCMTSVTIKGS